MRCWRVEHVDRVDRFLRAAHAHDVLQRLLHRPIARHGDRFRRHDSARDLRRIAEQQRERLARGRVERLREPVALARRELAKEIGLLIGGHRLEQRRGARGVDLLEDLRAPLELRLVEHLHHEIERKRLDQLRRGIRLQSTQRLRDIHRSHRGEHLRQLGRIAGQEIEELGGVRFDHLRPRRLLRLRAGHRATRPASISPRSRRPPRGSPVRLAVSSFGPKSSR